MISLVALWISSDVLAQIRIEIPHRRPNPGSDGPGLRDLAAGLLALKDGYDRSRRGFVCVLAYEDANGNGKRDRGEAPLPGWSFNITDAAGASAASGATDGKGRFCNEQPLTPGGYVVSQARVEGWVNREPGGAVASKPVTLPANQSVTVLFGNCQGERCGGRGPNQPARPEGPPPPKFTGRICVTKFEDQNGNGVRDGQEWVLPGWTINVLNSAGTLVALGTTNMQGEFCTPSSLNPGAYEVSEVVSGGWINTSPGGPSHILPLALGQTATWTFGNQRIPSTGICITKFNDLNGDGVKQANEPKLPGWVFTIVGPGGTVLAPNSATSTTVCHSGPFSAGPTTVSETAQPGWTPTTPGGASQTFTLVPTHNRALLFGNRQLPATARVCVRKYKDANGNGQRDPGEPLLPGWIFSVKTPAGAMLAFGTTDAQGQWCSSATLPSGLVSVIETTKPGWTSTDPGGAAPAKPATLVPGQTANLLFGNRQPPPPPPMGQLCVAKFQDLDSDGLYTSSDLRLPGWSFTLAGPSGPITLTTGALGSACTPVSLLLGTYTVTEVLQPGWSSTSPGGLAPQRTRVVTAGANGAGLMFGNIHADRGQICVNKYQDLNRDRKRSPSDPPLAGFSFQVLNAAGAVVATGVTDAQGRWCSSKALPVGAYSVVEVQQPGWVPTDPNGPPMVSPPYDKPATLTATRGAELWFGNIRSGRACVTKYNDLNGNGRRDPGEPPLAGWDFRFEYVSAGAATSVHIITDASGRACIDLPPGATHQVVEMPQPGWAPTEPPTALLGSNGLPYARHAFTVVEGQTVELVFGNRSTAPAAPGSVCLVKYSDLDQDRVRDPGEAGLPGWVFNLTTGSGAAAGTITTGPQGRACKELAPGAYVALEVAQPGWTNTDPPGATPQKPFTVVSGQTVVIVFGNHQKPPPVPTGKFCVGKYNDLNGDAAYQLGEPMLAGWQFTVTGPSGPFSLTTGANGRACTGTTLLYGNYVVTEVTQPGWISTAPGGTTPQVTVGLTNAGIPNAMFGNRTAPPPPQPRLTISKSVDLDCGTVQGIANPCVFRIRITNVDAVAYVGPVSFSDSVGFNGNIVIAGSTTLVAPLPPGWTCNASGPPNLCTGNVNLAPGQFADVVLTMNLAHVVMPKENCVRLTAPITAGPACVAF